MTALKPPPPKRISKDKAVAIPLLVLLWWIFNAIIEIKDRMAAVETKIAVLQDRNERKEK